MLKSFVPKMIGSKSWLIFLFRWLVAIGLLLFIFSKTDSNSLWRVLRGFDPVFGVLLVVCHSLVLILMAFRWRSIARQLHIEAPYSDYLRAVWLGALSGQIGPPLIFSEVTRFKVLQGCGDSRSLIGSQLIDRLSGLVALGLILLLMLPFNWPVFAESVSVVAISIGAMLATILATFLYRLALSAKIRAAISGKKIGVILNPGQSHYETSSLIQLLLMLGFLLAAYGLDEPRQPFTLFTLLPLIFAGLTLLPISVSDWGTREMFAVFVLSFAGLPPEESAAISLIYGFGYSLTASLGLLFLLKK